MELLDLIRLADSAPQVMSLLASYVETLRGAAALPAWWHALPLESPDHVQQRMLALLGLVHTASRRLDDRACARAKQALHVFAFAAWKLRGAGGRKR